MRNNSGMEWCGTDGAVPLLLLWMMVGAIMTMLSSCGGSDAPVLNSEPTVRPLLQRILDQALRDSSQLVGGSFRAFAVMNMELHQEEQQARVEDRFDLSRDTGASYVAQQRSHVVEGDTSLLKNMYTFEDARGSLRAEDRAHLASLDFGTSFPTLLRTLLSGGEQSGFQLRSSDTVVGSIHCSAIDYSTDSKTGRFWVDNKTLALVRLEVRQQSNYGVGSYNYHADIDFRRHDALLLPVATVSQFVYRRLMTEGNGRISVQLNDIVVGNDTTAMKNH